MVDAGATRMSLVCGHVGRTGDGGGEPQGVGPSGGRLQDTGRSPASEPCWAPALLQPFPECGAGGHQGVE